MITLVHLLFLVYVLYGLGILFKKDLVPWWQEIFDFVVNDIAFLDWLIPIDNESKEFNKIKFTIFYLIWIVILTILNLTFFKPNTSDEIPEVQETIQEMQNSINDG